MLHIQIFSKVFGSPGQDVYSLLSTMNIFQYYSFIHNSKVLSP